MKTPIELRIIINDGEQTHVENFKYSDSPWFDAMTVARQILHGELPKFENVVMVRNDWIDDVPIFNPIGAEDPGTLRAFYLRDGKPWLELEVERGKDGM